jgi:hypothetical protein
MARRYENSPEDEAEDAAGMKATGKSKKAYEGSARDRKEDAAGEGRIKVKPHFRTPPKKPAPPPAPAPSMLAPAPGEDNDDFGGM